MKKVLLFSALAILLCFTPAMAKEGPYVGVGLTYVNITSAADSYFDTVDPALGLELRFGYNFGPMALEGNFIGSNHEDHYPGFSSGDLTGWSIDLRLFLFPRPQPNQLYLLMGVGGYTFKETYNVTGDQYRFSGPGFNFGMGFEYFLNEQVAIDVRGVYRFINYNLDINGFNVATNVNGDTFTLGLALNFHF
ncbi:MAG TPA: porin family protein [Nitrospirota bacterium]|nr:porin family protein [Nitrospirota bacterium]